MKWIFTPYVGVNDLKFGMTLEDVEKIYGKAERAKKRDGNYVKAIWSNDSMPVLEFTDDILKEITFGAEEDAEFIVCGMDALSTDPITFLKGIVEHDKDTLARYPSIASYKFGIRFTMDPLGDADKCFTIFARGRQDELIPDMKPVTSSDYTIFDD